MPNIRKRFSFELQNFSIIDPNEEYFYDGGKAMQIREGLMDTSKWLGAEMSKQLEEVANMSRQSEQDVTNITNWSEEVDDMSKRPEEVANMSKELTDRSKQSEEVANKST